jgi:hypothetical protein
LEVTEILEISETRSYGNLGNFGNYRIFQSSRGFGSIGYKISEISIISFFGSLNTAVPGIIFKKKRIKNELFISL